MLGAATRNQPAGGPAGLDGFAARRVRTPRVLHEAGRAPLRPGVESPDPGRRAAARPGPIFKKG